MLQNVNQWAGSYMQILDVFLFNCYVSAEPPWIPEYFSFNPTPAPHDNYSIQLGFDNKLVQRLVYLGAAISQRCESSSHPTDCAEGLKEGERRWRVLFERYCCCGQIKAEDTIDPFKPVVTCMRHTRGPKTSTIFLSLYFSLQSRKPTGAVPLSFKEAVLPPLTHVLQRSVLSTG